MYKIRILTTKKTTLIASFVISSLLFAVTLVASLDSSRSFTNLHGVPAIPKAYAQNAGASANTSCPLGSPATTEWAPVNEYDSYFTQAAEEFGVPANVLKAMAMIESGGVGHYDANGNVIQGCDRYGQGCAIGIMQVKPEVWYDPQDSIGKQIGADPNTPEGNIRLAAKLMADFIKETGSWENAITQKYHPGVGQFGLSPDGYVLQVKDYLIELEAADCAKPTPPTQSGTSGSNSSDCVVTKVGSPSGEVKLPANCKTGSGGSVPAGNFVYYCQGDPRWKDTCSLGNAGCGPTSVAMVISTLSKPMTPPEVDTEFQTVGARTCSETGSKIVPNVTESQWFKGLGLVAGENVGGLLNEKSTASLLEIEKILDSGQLILASSNGYPCVCGNPDRTISERPGASHIVVIQSVDVDNRTFTIRDPSNCYYSDIDGHQAGEEGAQNIPVPIDAVNWIWAFPIQKVN